MQKDTMKRHWLEQERSLNIAMEQVLSPRDELHGLKPLGNVLGSESWTLRI